MNFKEWIYNELSGRNAYQRMVNQHPGYVGMPRYVRDEFIKSSLGSAVNSSSARAMQARSDGQQTGPVMRPQDFLNNSSYKDKSWSKAPVWLDLTPNLLTKDTLDLLVKRCFGFRGLADIRNDTERTSMQKSLLGSGDQEPVILFRVGNQYKLQEGWHRTMNLLLWEGDESKGAPAQQINILKQYAQLFAPIDAKYGGRQLSGADRMQWLLEAQPLVQDLYSKLNFGTWKPVKIKAYIGNPVQAQQQGNPSPEYEISTAIMPQSVASTSA